MPKTFFFPPKIPRLQRICNNHNADLVRIFYFERALKHKRPLLQLRSNGALTERGLILDSYVNCFLEVIRLEGFPLLLLKFGLQEASI